LHVLEKIQALSPDTLTGVLTIDDTGDTRSVLEDIRAFASRHDLPLHVAGDRHESERIIRIIAPDLCMVVGWYWLISPDTLESVPSGFIGIHNSLLPKYRGGSPLVWAMINGDPEAGFSLFTLGEGMDSGGIWAQDSVGIEANDTIAEVLDKLEAKTLGVIEDKYLPILRGEISPVDQDHSAATYCAQRSPGDGNIDWAGPATVVHNFIRAQSAPYPGAFTYAVGRLLKIWRTEVPDRPCHGSPGEVVRMEGGGVCVICGDRRALVLRDVELDGRRGKAEDLLPPGDCIFSREPG